MSTTQWSDLCQRATHVTCLDYGRRGRLRGDATLGTPARVHHISGDESPPTPAPCVAVADHRSHDGVHIFAVEEDPLPEL